MYIVSNLPNFKAFKSTLSNLVSITYRSLLPGTRSSITSYNTEVKALGSTIHYNTDLSIYSYPISKNTYVHDT